MDGRHENVLEPNEACLVEIGMEVLSQREGWTAGLSRSMGWTLQRNSATPYIGLNKAFTWCPIQRTETSS